MLGLRTLATKLRGSRGGAAEAPIPDPDAEDELTTEELAVLRRELEGELARVGTPSAGASR